MDASDKFFADHPEIRHRMVESKAFSQIKEEARVVIDGEVLYVVMGDVLGEEEELFVESVIRGAEGQGRLNQDVFDELPEEERSLILEQFRR